MLEYSFETADDWDIVWDPDGIFCHDDKKKYKLEICGCSGESAYILMEKPLELQLAGTDNPGMKNILVSDVNYQSLNDDGKKLIEQCVDFLLYQENINAPSGSYVTLWSFIYDCLKIPRNSGYDYYLMNHLQALNLIDHGSGIRCAWFNESNELFAKDKTISDDNITMMKMWGSKCI